MVHEIYYSRFFDGFVLEVREYTGWYVAELKVQRRKKRRIRKEMNHFKTASKRNYIYHLARAAGGNSYCQHSLHKKRENVQGLLSKASSMHKYPLFVHGLLTGACLLHKN